MQVRQIMTSPAEACRPDDSLGTAAATMWKRDCGVLPVVEKDDRVVGMITDRDICMATIGRDVPPHAIDVTSSMTSGPRSCGPEQPVEDVLELMRDYQIRRLPVVDREGRLMGIVSLTDIVRSAERDHDTRHEDVIDTMAAIGSPRRG